MTATHIHTHHTPFLPTPHHYPPSRSATSQPYSHYPTSHSPPTHPYCHPHFHPIFPSLFPPPSPTLIPTPYACPLFPPLFPPPIPTSQVASLKSELQGTLKALETWILEKSLRQCCAADSMTFEKNLCDPNDLKHGGLKMECT